jgi:B12-binding domain/radical SAM domain protein
MRLFAADLVLLHPPSVYDFRSKETLFGPVSDLIPSTPVFEMYPMGLTTIAAYLENEGFNVEIINVAHRMLLDSQYDVEKEISKLRPALFGIDLHWLPHAHGGTELAKIVKKYHPDTPVIFGGISASYYQRELIEYPCVDLVMRGDSTEQPLLLLLRALRFGGSLSAIPNLTWKEPDGTVVVNELSHVPESIDHLSIPNYLYTMRSVFKYGSLANVLPYVDWLDYPITALLTSRGCTLNCAICGGSEFAYQRIFNRAKPAFRSPEALVKDILLIQEFSRAPIFLIHDVRQGGEDHFGRFIELLSKESIENELIFELFYPAGADYFSAISKAVSRFSLEMTLESHVEELRERNGKLVCSNEEIEATIDGALRGGVNRIDIFFMVGIPWQTYDQAVECSDYCRHLLERFHGDPRLCFFNAPLAPFLDPGSLAFESPEEYGYRRLRTTLEEHRQALTAPSWKHVLNYETVNLSRDDIVRATYETGLRLARLKLDFGIIDQKTYDQLATRLQASRTAIDQIDDIMQLPEGPERRAKLAALKSTVDEMSVRTMGAKHELKWPIPGRFGKPIRVTRLLLRLFLTEAYLFFFKRTKLFMKRGYSNVRGKRPAKET